MNSKHVHAQINLDFGEGRLQMAFDPRRRNWHVEEQEDEEEEDVTDQ